MTGPPARPGKERRPDPKAETSSKQTGGGKSGETKLALDGGTVPQLRPWSGRPDADQLEERFRRDRAGWRRRVDCARRLSYDARDEAVAPDGRWTP
jgi:hypothetical protein